jgi:Glycosyltransferase family 87
MHPATNPASASPWHNPVRIRRQALLLAMALWLGYAATLATPGMHDRFGHLKGADFLHSYILGTLALEHRGGALYDARIQRDIGDERVPESAGDYFLPVYPPQYSLIWLPLAKLPYAWAAAIWIFLSAAIYAACCYAVWRTCPNLSPYGGTVALLAAAFPGFFGLITFGQNSALALACFTGMYFALRAERDLLAGLCLGLLACKPQLALLAACVFAIAWVWPGKPRRGASVVVAGAAISVLAQLLAAWAWYGPGPLLTYAHVLTHLASMAHILEPRPYLIHSLRAFWNLLLPWPRAAFVLYLLTALPTVVLAVACWRRPAPLEHRFAVILLTTVLVAPHLTVYDLVILVPALLWIGDWLMTHGAPRTTWLLYLCYIAPFAGPLSRWTHLQLSVICLAALTVTLSQQVFPADD